jgi:hypothetical protein
VPANGIQGCDADETTLERGKGKLSADDANAQNQVAAHDCDASNCAVRVAAMQYLATSHKEAVCKGRDLEIRV